MLFFFNDTATTEIYTLSLHDALPISKGTPSPLAGLRLLVRIRFQVLFHSPHRGSFRLSLTVLVHYRSEEHTSELQSQSNLVCRLLLEKKNHSPSGRGTRKRRLD